MPIASLITGIYDPMEPNTEALKLKFDQQSKKWLFKYYAKPNKPVEFERVYEVEKGIQKFDAFIKMINW